MYKVDMYVRVRRACMVEGMSILEADRVFGLHRDTGRKMLMYSVPPGYRRERPPWRPKLEPYTGVIDRILDEELGLPKKQRHTAKRVRFSMESSSGSTTSFWTFPTAMDASSRRTLQRRPRRSAMGTCRGTDNE